METITRKDLEAAAAVVHAHVPPTPEISWPLLSRRVGCQRQSKSTPLAGVKMHHLMRFIPALAVVPVVHRRDPRCFV